jgi:polysaccharide biosynthesis/export protein
MRTTKQMVGLWMSCLAALSLVATAAAPVRASGRILSKFDVVVIKVVNQPDMDTTTRVELDGTVTFPYVGRIKAAGRTEDDLAHAIERRLAARQIVTEPQVLVQVTQFGAQASVQGQVEAPGVYGFDRPTNLAQLLARAGGLKESGGTVILRRKGPRGVIVTRYDGRDIVAGKIDGESIQIQNNDEIFVDLIPFYYVYGYVGKTGEYPLARPLTVQQAIAIAGGLAPLGADWRIKIKRRSAGGQTEELPASLDDEVQPNDTIVVNERIF